MDTMAEGDKKIPNPVIIAIDGSDQSEYAFQFYCDNLHQKGQKVLVLHCVEQMTVIGEMPSVDLYSRMVDEGKTKAKALEDKYYELMKSNQVAGQILAVFNNRPGEVIINQAKEKSALMIVMGTRGLSRMRKTVLGSVSDFVVHHATCPVVIAKQTT